MVLELIAELLPRHLLAHFAEKSRDVPLVLGIFAPLEMFTLAFNDPHEVVRAAVDCTLRDKVRPQAVPPVALNAETVLSDQVAVPPQHVLVAIEAQRDRALVRILLLFRDEVEQGLLRQVAVVMRERPAGPDSQLARDLEPALRAL